MAVHPNLIYRFSAIPIKISPSNFVDIEKLILKFIWKGKRPRLENTILKEKNKVRGQTLSNFKTYYKAKVIEAMWHWCKDKLIIKRTELRVRSNPPHI